MQTTTTNTRTNPYHITPEDLAEVLQATAEHLEANPHAVDALAQAALEDYNRKRQEMGLDGPLPPVLQFRAIARYAYLLGYGLALEEAEEVLADLEAKQ